MAAESASLLETLKALDALGVAGVLGFVLRWALKRIEAKDEQIADLANRSAAALERAVDRISEGGRGER